MEEGRVDELVDGRLGGKFPAEEAVPVVKLGLICTSQVPSNRPGMSEVIMTACNNLRRTSDLHAGKAFPFDADSQDCQLTVGLKSASRPKGPPP
ncbi:hypothetical protein MUK42_03699 [Musa troglodytarum]|uniref:Uncharacterized protein n=1 Tax=Musa troglodytarum TaxID=320322 RepID=A0A9E7FUW6_9LILI|nr:hypothetical protein MUK42_03699 [Musa troglodytarum]